MMSFRAFAAALLYAPSAVLAANLLVSHYNGNVYSVTFTQSGTTGTLAIKSQLKAGGNMPSWLTFDYASSSLYVTEESTGGTGQIYQVKATPDGTLTSVGTGKGAGGEVMSALYGGSDGKSYLAGSEYDTSSIVTWKLPLSGGASLQKQTFTMSKKGPVASRQDKPHPHSVFTDPTGKFLVSADLGADLIRVFSIDASGKLTSCANVATGAGDGPRHGAFWATTPGADSTMLFVVNELGNSVSVWKVSYSGGCLGLTKTQTLSTYPAGKSAPAGSKAAEVHVAGNFVYAANRNDKSFGAKEDSLAMYSIDPSSGALTWVEATSTHTWYTRTFQINKAGDLCVFGGQTSGNIAVVTRDPTTGKMGSLVAQLAVGGAGRDGQEDGLSAVIWNE